MRFLLNVIVSALGFVALVGLMWLYLVTLSVGVLSQ